MAAATSVTRHTAVLGPLKVEFIQGTFATSTDTVETRLVNASWALAVPNATANGDASTAISGKTITVSLEGGSNVVVRLIVVGF